MEDGKKTPKKHDNCTQCGECTAQAERDLMNIEKIQRMLVSMGQPSALAIGIYPMVRLTMKVAGRVPMNELVMIVTSQSYAIRN